MVRYTCTSVSVDVLWTCAADRARLCCEGKKNSANVPDFNSQATNVTFGGSAQYLCYESFQFASGKEQEEIYCTDEGRWTPTPICRAKTCPALPPFNDGKRTLSYGDGTGYGTVYSYHCAPGYQREGAPALLCQNNGQWSSVQPVCKRKPCFRLPEIENGRLLEMGRDSTMLYYGDTLKVKFLF